MRILRLDLDDGEELDLHPYVTVLGGLSPAAHRRVADQLARLVKGDAGGISGLVEANDILTEISPEVVAALELPPDTDSVVSAADLPGATLASTGSSGGLADQIAVARAELEKLDGELEAARERVSVATDELDEARRGLDDFAITAHDAARAAVAKAEAAAVEAVHGAADGDPSGAGDERAGLIADLEATRERASTLEGQLDAERLALLELLEELEAERAELDEARRAVDEDDGDRDEVAPPAPPVPSLDDVVAVERQLEAVRLGPAPAPLEPSQDALALADEIAAHRARHDLLEAELREEGIDVAGIQRALEQAQTAAERAAADAQPKVVSPADDAEIERLHDIVVDQGERRNSRRGGKGAERAYEEASEALDALLEKVGYPTYAAYVMGRLAPSVDPEAKRRHDEALARVAELEAELDRAGALLERDTRVLVLRAERDQLWAAARDMLGTLPDDVEGALRDLRVPARVENTAVDDLRNLLARLGAPTESTEEAAVVAAAETFLADAALARDAADRASAAEPDEAVDPRVARLAEVERRVSALHEQATAADAALADREQEHDRLLARLDELHAALEELDAQQSEDDTDDRPAADPRVQSDPRVVQAREQLALVEVRLARHQAAVARVDERHATLREARSAEREALAARDAAHAELERIGEDADPHAPLPEVTWELDERGVEPLEWYLLGRVSALRRVSHAGSVPLVLDDAFRGLDAASVRSLCDALARISESVQVLYVGENEELSSWAAEQGLDTAAVVRPGQPAL